MSAPRGDLSRFVPAAPRVVGRLAVTYSDASTDFGLGGVLLLPATREAFWFRTRVPRGDPIDRLEVEAAAVVDALFGPLLAARGYTEEISFMDNNVSCAWITRGRGRADVDPMLSALCCGCRWKSAGPSSGLSASPPPPALRTGPAGALCPMVRAVGACGKCRGQDGP